MVNLLHSRRVFGFVSRHLVCRVEVREKRIALTFDDGPNPAVTPRLLDLLQAYGARATFFLIGRNATRYPGVAAEIARRGHEIGNHSYTHDWYCLRSAGFIREQLTKAQQAITEATGVAPVFFRAPYGVRWFGLRKVQQQLGLTGVMWTEIGWDWKLPADRIVRRMVRAARNGAIFCLHDGRDTRPHPDIRPTVEAVRRLLPELTAKGFRFETVSQILCPTT